MANELNQQHQCSRLVSKITSADRVKDRALRLLKCKTYYHFLHGLSINANTI